MGPEIFTIIITVASLLFGLLITGVTFFIVWKVISGFTKSMQASQQLIATGLPAQGRILAVQASCPSIASRSISRCTR
jgi:hypothetical protein